MVWGWSGLVGLEVWGGVGRKVLRGPTGRVTLGYRAAKLLRKETIVKDCADR